MANPNNLFLGPTEQQQQQQQQQQSQNETTSGRSIVRAILGDDFEFQTKQSNSSINASKKLAPSIAKLKRKPRTWTASEDKFLRNAVETHNGKKWKLIAECVPGRTQAQCHQRWTKALSVANKRGTWTREEDLKLMALRTEHGDNYKLVAKQMGTRTVKQCVERWKNNLDPSLNHNPFTAVEDAWLKQLAEAYEGKWADIAREMPGRTEHMVKARVRAMQKLLRKNKRAKIVQDDTALAALESSTEASQPRSNDDPNKRTKLGSSSGLGIFKRFTNKLSSDPMVVPVAAASNSAPISPPLTVAPPPQPPVPASTPSTTMEADRLIISQLCALNVQQHRRHDSGQRPTLKSASRGGPHNDFVNAFDSSNALDADLDSASTAAVNAVFSHTRTPPLSTGETTNDYAGNSIMSLGKMGSLNSSVGTFKLSSLSDEAMREAMIEEGDLAPFVRPQLTRTDLPVVPTSQVAVENDNEFNGHFDDLPVPFVKPPLTRTSLAGHDLQAYINKIEAKNCKMIEALQQRPGNNRGNRHLDLDGSSENLTHLNSATGQDSNNFNIENGTRPNLQLDRSSSNIFFSVNGGANGLSGMPYSNGSMDLNWSIGSFPNVGNNDTTKASMDEQATAAARTNLVLNSSVSLISVDALSDRFLLNTIRDEGRSGS